MTDVAKLVVVLALVAGCGKTTPDCAHAISGATSRIVAEAKASMPAAVAANVARIQPKLTAAITSACVEDKWAPAVIACVDRATSQSELDACDKQLTPDQRKHEHERDDEILKLAIQPH